MRARELAAVAALAGSMLLAVAPPAAALGVPGSLDCKEAPIPARPDQGMAAWFDKGNPAVPDGNAFTDPALSVFDVYGFSGLEHSVYDLGCTPSGDAIAAGVMTPMGNLLGALVTFGFGLAFAVLRAVLDPTWLSIFDPVLTSIVASLAAVPATGRSVVGLVFALGAVLTAIVVVSGRREGDLSAASTALGKVLLVVAAIGTLIAGPLVIASLTDRAVVGAVNGSSAAVAGLTGGVQRNPGDAVAGLVSDKVVYPLWLRGMVGSSDSKVAVDYGPDLWRATHLSWAESRDAATSTDAASRIFDAKADLYEQTAEEVKEADRSAYQVLTGKASGERFATMLLLAGAGACFLPVLAFAGALLLMSYLVVRVASASGPVIAPLALYAQTGEKIVLGVLSYVGVALRNAIVFGAALALFVPFLAGVLLAPIPLWLALALLLALTVAFLKITKPFRSLNVALVPKSVKRAAKVGAGLYLASKVGEHAVEDALEDDAERREKEKGKDDESGTTSAAAEATTTVDMGPTTSAEQSGTAWPDRTEIGGARAGLPVGTCEHGAQRGACAVAGCLNAPPVEGPVRNDDGTWTAPAPSPPEPAREQPALFAAQSDEGLRSAEDQYRVEREQRIDWGDGPTIRVDWSQWPDEVAHPAEWSTGGKAEPFAVDAEVDPVTGQVVHHVVYEPPVLDAGQ